MSPFAARPVLSFSTLMRMLFSPPFFASPSLPFHRLLLYFSCPSLPLISSHLIFPLLLSSLILFFYRTIDVRGKMWICPLCYQRNQFPPHYNSISETNLPTELYPSCSTIEYTLSQPALAPPIFLFVVDTCLDEKNLQQLKESLLMSLSLIPENSLVGLITFGTTVQVFELAFADCPKSWVFRGSKDVTAKDVQQLLGLGGPRPGMAPGTPQIQHNKFLRPFSEIEVTLETILEELQRDPRPVKNDRRPLRSTGVALSVAIGLLENSYAGTGARIMLFTGGPATQGPGLVVGDQLKEPIRSHHDINKDNVKHMYKAQKYYDSLAQRAVDSGHVVDLFACSLDQVGLMEMRNLVKMTGGITLQADMFDDPMFKESYAKIFTADERGILPMAFNATTDILTSREIKVCGAIGHCASIKKKSAYVAETEIGAGGTSAWRLCGADSSSTYAFYFEVVNQHSSPVPQQGQNGVVQFLTTYQRCDGRRILRVTTTCHGWAPMENLKPALTMGFDQEAAAVLMARIAVYKAESEDSFDVLRWLDRMLIRLVSKFGDYHKDDPNSFQLSPNFSIYPQFMFHLRRSHFLQVFNYSPDETTFFRFMLNRENVTNSLTMIQPTLEEYSFNGPPRPVLLSATSVSGRTILLLDTFFHVVIMRGEEIAAWYKEGYQNDPQHENFRQLLAAPKHDAELIIKDRFPLPRFIECDQHSSQSRYVLATIDPSITHQSSAMGQQNTGEVIFTEDVNLKVFMEHLKKLAVQS
ncbi:GTPase-activating protein S23, variant 2 [Balamuthia mandrillaris]